MPRKKRPKGKTPRISQKKKPQKNYRLAEQLCVQKRRGRAAFVLAISPDDPRCALLGSRAHTKVSRCGTHSSEVLFMPFSYVPVHAVAARISSGCAPRQPAHKTALRPFPAHGFGSATFSFRAGGRRARHRPHRVDSLLSDAFSWQLGHSEANGLVSNVLYRLSTLHIPEGEKSVSCRLANWQCRV